MQSVAERALQLTETKTIRRVRTEAGVRRYKQPIGSIIMNDSLLVGVREIAGPRGAREGTVRLQGDNGKTYLITPGGTQKRISYWTAMEEDSLKVIYEGPDQISAYALTAQHVQEEAGIDTRGPGRLGSGGKREGWSENQLEAASEAIFGWANTATDSGNTPLAYAMWEIAGAMTDGYTPHRDARVARHQLEQLKLRDDLNLDDHLGDDPDEQTFRSLINNAIVDLRNEAKLPKKYDADVEAAYSDEALKDAAANANKSRPVKTQDIARGQWIRSVDDEGNPKGDWFKVTDIGEQSRIAGRSRIIRGVTRDGKKVSLTRQGPRNKWETIGDPKDEPAYTPPEPPAPENVVKRIDRLREKDFTTISGTDIQGNPVTDTGYVQNEPIFDKDDWSRPERRKTPVYTVVMSDDRAGKVNVRKFIVPKGTMSGPQEDASEKPVDDVASRISANKEDWPMQPVESDYEGYNKFIGKDGKAYYTDVDAEGWDLYDADDNVIASSRGKGVDAEGLYAAMEAAVDTRSTSGLSAKTPRGYDPTRHPNLTEAESEYEGYDKFVGRGGKAVYLAQEDGKTVAYDANDKEIGRSADRQQLLDALNTRFGDPQADRRAAMEKLGITPTSSLTQRIAEKETAGPALKRLKSKFDGWKRFKLPDGRVVDTGQATDDDGRWYATGKGGWDDIVADGDSEEEMLGKLRTIAGIDQPVTFSPSNTDVVPKREPEASPIMGMSRDDYLAAKRRGAAIRSSVVGSGGGGTVDVKPRAASGSRDQARISRTPEAPGAVPDKAPSAQRADDEAERRAAGFTGDARSDLAQAREQAARINQQMRDSNSTSPLPRGSKVRDLDTRSAPVTRNGKPLTAKDNDLIPQYDLGNGERLNRLKPPNNRNLNDRLLRVAPMSDQAAYEAVQDRATENYLNGMTHAAAWKEAIETAERIKVPEHYVMEDATRDGNGQARVMRQNLDGTREEVATYRPRSYREFWRAKQDAKGRMTLENAKARVAATRSVPILGTPSPVQTPEKPSATTTAGATAIPAGSAEEQIRSVVSSIDSNGGWVDLARVRAQLPSVSREDFDSAIRALNRQPGINVEGRPDRWNLTQQDQDAAVSIAGDPRHMIAVQNSGGGGTARKAEVQSNIVQTYKNFVESLPADTTIKGGPYYMPLDQLRGWTESQGISRDELDRELIDMATTGNRHVRLVGESNQKVLRDSQRAAAIDFGNQPKHYIVVEPELTGPIGPRNGATGDLDSQDDETRLANLRPQTRMGPNYSRSVTEDLRRYEAAKRKGEDDTARAWLVSAEENAGLRPRGAYNAYQAERDKGAMEQARAENREMSIANQAARIDEAGARRLAKEDPARFFEVVGYRYFKQGKDFRKKENATYARAYDEMLQYAEQMRQAEGLPGGTIGTMQGILVSLRINHAGMMGIGRTMMTIRKVFKEENGL